MQKHPLILVLLAASGISHAAGLCDDLDADAPPVEYAAMSAPVLQKAAASPQAQAIPDLSNRLGVNMPVPAGAKTQWELNQAAAKIGIRGTEGGMNPAPQNTERYANSDANPVHRVSDAPVSTFSIDVDTGSYSNIRRMLTRENRLPPADAVRVEEILNYFAYGYPLPQDGKPFAVHTQTVDSPWQADAKLIRIAIQAADLAPEKRPPANLVFLIDTSGSMNAPDKLPLVKKTVCHFAEALRADDRISLITYSGSTAEILPPTAGDQKETIIAALKPLRAHGATAGGEALRMAYDAAAKNYRKDGINRILLATDGDFNVGISDPATLKNYVADKRKSGISLTTLGYGRGNYNDETMEQLADAGDGNYSYIDSEAEAKKVLVRQLTSTLATVARDIKIQLEFNPAAVKEYRLVGYENRLLREEDFNNDRVDAGDIGAGHNTTALYEIIPQGKTGWLDARHYQNAPAASGKADEYGWLKLRYKAPESEQSQLIEQPIAAKSIPLADAEEATRFAIAAASYAQALKGGKYNGALDWAGILRLAQAAQGSDPYGERAGLLQLIDKARELSSGK